MLRQPHLAALRRLKAEMERLDGFLTSEWVASEENISDGPSRDLDRDVWKLNPRVFLWSWAATSDLPAAAMSDWTVAGSWCIRHHRQGGLPPPGSLPAYPN